MYGEVSKFLKEVREKKGLSLRDAERLTKINYAHLSQIENSKSIPKLEILLKLADVYGIEIENIIKLAKEGVIKKTVDPKTYKRDQGYVSASFPDLTEAHKKQLIEYLDFLFYKQRKHNEQKKKKQKISNLILPYETNN